MNFRTLRPDELARLAECGNQGAIDYMIENAHDLLTGAAELGESRLTAAYNNGRDDGIDDGRRKALEQLMDEYEQRIEDEMARTLGKQTDPETLGTKKRRRWELFSELLQSFE